MSGGSVKDVSSKVELDNAIKQDQPTAVVVVHFWSEASKKIDKVFSHLSIDFPHAHFLRVQVQELPDIVEAYYVSVVPSFIFFKDGERVDILENADANALANKVTTVAGLINPVDLPAPSE